MIRLRARRLSSWGVVAPRTAVLALSVALVLLTAPIAATAANRSQFIQTSEPSVSVNGVGEATAPAESAEVQLLVSRDPSEFSFSETSDGGSSSVSTSASAPSADEPATDRLSADTLVPILDAIAAAGVERDEIAIVLSPLPTSPFGGPGGSARLDFAVADPSTDGLAELIGGAAVAASTSGLVVEFVGVLYEVADCLALEDEAQQAAITDAGRRAERLAAKLDVSLGTVIGASTYDVFGFGAEGGCGDDQSTFYDSGYGGLSVTLPPFDPARPAEVEVYSNLLITYAIVADESA